MSMTFTVRPRPPRPTFYDAVTSFVFASILTLVSGAILGGCSCTPPKPPDPPPTPNGATCATACDRLRQLGCPEAKPTPEGGTCEAVCENVQSSGIIAWDLTCRTNAPSCAAVDGCEG